MKANSINVAIAMVSALLCGSYPVGTGCRIGKSIYQIGNCGTLILMSVT